MRTPRITAAHLGAGTELSEPRLSPDGRHVAYGVSAAGRSALVVQPVGGGPARPVTADPAPRTGRWDGGGCFGWTPDGTALVHTAGDGALWWTALAGGPSRRLTGDDPGAPAQAPVVSPDGRAVAYVRDVRDVHMDALDGSGGVVVSDTPFAVDPVWHPDGTRVAWQEWAPPHMAWDESRVQAATAAGGRALLHGEPGVQAQQPRWSPDGRSLAFLADTSGWLTLWVADADGRRPRQLLPDGHELAGPTWGHGQRTYAWSPDGSTIVFVRNEHGFASLATVDVATGAVAVRARAWHAGLDWQGDVLVALRSGARTPTQLVAYDTTDWSRRVLAVGPHGVFDDDDAPEPDLVRWAAPDGTTVPARLYRPTGTTGPNRLLVWVHGGPTGQWGVTFNPRIAYWLARGWSVLVPDHRGSTGHGRAFTQSLREQWGVADVDDVAAGVRAALTEGWGRAGGIALMGGSAGGFTVLHVLARHPGLVAAAVASYPVTDLAALDATTHRFEAHYNRTLVGPRPQTDHRYRERSPITHASAVRDPLLLFHGDADEVVAVEQTRSFAAAATAAGAPVELVVYEGEGHGFRRQETIADELARTEAFLDAHVR